MNQLFDAALNQRVEITFPLLLQKRNNGGTQRKNFVLYMRNNLCILIIEQGYKCFNFCFLQHDLILIAKLKNSARISTYKKFITTETLAYNIQV